VNIADLNAAVTTASGALTTINAALPVAMTAYSVLKAIWLRMNPGKTEADFVGYLQATSQQNIDDTAALLVADGYVEDPPGTWRKQP